MLTAITGINWGDEGKGRMVDLLCRDYDIVARYQGGDNAGHTVKNERGKFVLNLVPSGILHPSIVCVMGGGMVIDPEHLEKEIAALREQGVKITPDNLKISDRATITMPFHVEQDGLEEARLAKTGAQFGSTKRGIAYTYGDKYMKKTLRMGDLVHMDASVRKRLETLVESKNLTMVNIYNQKPVSVDDMWNWCKHFQEVFSAYICDVGQYLADADDAGKFRTALYWERGFELAFEGQRKYDLIRWGVIKEALTLFSSRSSVKSSYPAGDNFQKGKHELFPIPLDELQLNPMFESKNNPNY